MSDQKEPARDFASNWMTWQQDFWKNWSEAARKSMDMALSGFQGGDGFAQAMQTWFKNFQQAMSGKPMEGGLGPEVFGKALDASRMYADVMGFWAKAMGPLMEMKPGQPLSAEKIKDMYSSWSEQYSGLMQSMWGHLPGEEAQETARAFESASKVGSDYLWTYLEPMLKGMEGLPGVLERVAKGDPGAMFEVSGLFRKNYEATVGKALRAPSLGYFREINELVGKTVDAYNEFNATMSEYATMFNNTGAKASEKVFQRLLEFQGKEVTADTPREFYKIWWTINEDTYHELFLSREFTGLLKEVLHRGLVFRKWMDELTDQFKELLNMPSKKDMDEIYKALYDLKKEVRWQARAIRQFEEHLGIQVKKPVLTEE